MGRGAVALVVVALEVVYTEEPPRRSIDPLRGFFLIELDSPDRRELRPVLASFFQVPRGCH